MESQNFGLTGRHSQAQSIIIGPGAKHPIYAAIFLKSLPRILIFFLFASESALAEF